jgi:hypothetical protein
MAAQWPLMAFGTIAALTLTLSAILLPAKAQDKYLLRSPGIESCKSFTDVADAEHKRRPPHAKPDTYYDPEYLAYLGFSLGLISGVNWRTTNEHVSEKTDTPAIMAWLEHYCREHPTDLYATAVESLYVELARTGQ